MIETKDDLLEEIRKLSAAWRTRSARKAVAALDQAWPPHPVMSSLDWAHLLDVLKRVRADGKDEITEQESASLSEAILLLEAWVYRC